MSSQCKSAVSETYPEKENSQKSIPSFASLYIYNVQTNPRQNQSMMKLALNAEGLLVNIALRAINALKETNSG